MAISREIIKITEIKDEQKFISYILDIPNLNKTHKKLFIDTWVLNYIRNDAQWEYVIDTLNYCTLDYFGEWCEIKCAGVFKNEFILFCDTISEEVKKSDISDWIFSHFRGVQSFRICSLSEEEKCKIKKEYAKWGINLAKQ